MRAAFFMMSAVLTFLSACSDASVVTNSSGWRLKPGVQEDESGIPSVVFFGFDRYDLTPEARATLDRQAVWLKQYPNVSVTIEGHADERGTREYNLAIGERRANAAKNYLVAQGTNPSRVKVISYGKERPAVLGSNEASWAQNRRGVTAVD